VRAVGTASDTIGPGGGQELLIRLGAGVRVTRGRLAYPARGR